MIGIEGTPGQLIFVVEVDIRVLSVRTSPANAAMVLINFGRESAQAGVNLIDWAIVIWDTTSMGQYRTEPVGSVHGRWDLQGGDGKPDVSDLHTLETIISNHLHHIKNMPWVASNATQC